MWVMFHIRISTLSVAETGNREVWLETAIYQKEDMPPRGLFL